MHVHEIPSSHIPVYVMCVIVNCYKFRRVICPARARLPCCRINWQRFDLVVCKINSRYSRVWPPFGRRSLRARVRAVHKTQTLSTCSICRTRQWRRRRRRSLIRTSGSSREWGKTNGSGSRAYLAGVGVELVQPQRRIVGADVCLARRHGRCHHNPGHRIACNGIVLYG